MVLDRARHLHRSLLLLTAGILAAAAAVAAPPPLVVAVDTSRSLRADELASATGTLAAALRQLPADTPTGLLAFDDAPRWVTPLGAPPAEVATALEGLQPRGNFTLLHDALFVAARELVDGGVVLTVTDGRDENSATTVEDVARLGQAQGVRLVTVAMGRRIEERGLRRLALLTGGTHLGSPAEVSGASLTAVLERLAAERAAAAAVASAPETAAAVPAALPAERQPDGGEAGATRDEVTPLWRRPLLLLLPVALLAAIAAVVLAARRTTHPRTRFCPRCGSELAPDETGCSHCDEEELLARLQDREAAPIAETTELKLEPAALENDTNPGVLEQTRVMTDKSLLVVREPGETQRTYLLRSDKAFAVGRAPIGNSLVLFDPALSAHHFKVVPDNGYYYLIDLASTNGTFLNRRRVRAARLASGDQIHAGQAELEFRSYLG